MLLIPNDVLLLGVYIWTDQTDKYRPNTDSFSEPRKLKSRLTIDVFAQKNDLMMFQLIQPTEQP